MVSSFTRGLKVRTKRGLVASSVSSLVLRLGVSRPRAFREKDFSFRSDVRMILDFSGAGGFLEVSSFPFFGGSGRAPSSHA